MGLLVLPSLTRSRSPLVRTFRDVPPALEIIPRAEWAGDLAPTGPLVSEDVRFLLVHHTASGNEYQRDDVPALLRGFLEYHTSAEKGWPDIAYNFLIDRFGRVWEGRDGSLDGPVAGDATGGNQGYTQLVSLIGNFSTESPTPEALKSLISVLAWLADRYQIETSPGASVSFMSRGSNRWPEGTELETPTIAGHRDMSLTECPGDVLYDYVTDGLAADVATFREVSSHAGVTSTTTTAATSTTSTTPGTLASTTTAVPRTTTTTPARADSLPPVAQSDPTGSDELPLGFVGGGLAIGISAIALAVRNIRGAQRRRSDEP